MQKVKLACLTQRLIGCPSTKKFIDIVETCSVNQNESTADEVQISEALLAEQQVRKPNT